MSPRFLFSVVYVLGLWSCGPKPAPSEPDPEPPPPPAPPLVEETEQAEDEPEKVTLEARLAEEAAASPGTIVGGATITTMLHCGGAAPDPDLPYSETRPYSVKLLLREGTENSDTEPMTEIHPLQDGSFSVDVPPGTYCLVVISKKDPPSGNPGMYMDSQCIQDQWNACDAVVEHPSGQPVWVSIRDDCFSPCYHGPMPP